MLIIPYGKNAPMCIALSVLFHRTVAHAECYAVCTVQIVLVHSAVLLFAKLHERPRVVSVVRFVSPHGCAQLLSVYRAFSMC